MKVFITRKIPDNNIVLMPHIASASEETRQAMSALVAENIIAVFEGRIPPTQIITR